MTRRAGARVATGRAAGALPRARRRAGGAAGRGAGGRSGGQAAAHRFDQHVHGRTGPAPGRPRRHRFGHLAFAGSAQRQYGGRGEGPAGQSTGSRRKRFPTIPTWCSPARSPSARPSRCSDKSARRSSNSAFPRRFDDVRRQIREVAAVIGEPERGEALVADIDRRLARISVDANRPPLRAIILRPNGFTVGPGSLVDEILRRAGMTNLAAAARPRRLPADSAGKAGRCSTRTC